ncbi:hypothetical protein Csa_023645, partial [Cucumis sativus]
YQALPLSVHSAVGPTPATLTLRLFTSLHSDVLRSAPIKNSVEFEFGRQLTLLIETTQKKRMVSKNKEAICNGRIGSKES